MFGIGEDQTVISAHIIAEAIGKEKFEALVRFHALQECDSISTFNEKGKK